MASIGARLATASYLIYHVTSLYRTSLLISTQSGIDVVDSVMTTIMMESLKYIGR